MSAHTADGSEDWRASVAQSFRSEEVRSIAKVLASLEPGATSASKTMLAMRFEESIFKGATGLDDYRKTIQKRLKKLQKHYAKQQAAAAAAGGGADGTTGGGATENADLTREKELLLESRLRDQFGPKLLYIAKHSDAAVALTSQKHGEHKADVLRQHATNAKQWAVHLGLELPEKSSNRNSFTRQEKRDMEFLKKLEGYLKARVENIRSHIVKITDADLFLEEALVKIDDVLLKEKVSSAFSKALMEVDRDKPQFTEEQMKELVDRMNASVPIPRRNQEGDRIKAAVARVEKVRAAAQALYIYMGLPIAAKTSFRGSMEKCHQIVTQCLTELETEYNHIVKDMDDTDESGKRIIQLEDAWNKPMQFAEELENEETTTMVDEASGEEPDAKKPKTDDGVVKRPMVIRSRYLLTKGRSTFSTLLPALKRKRATLHRNGSTTYVKLEFGKAFEMTIYLVPLLATIRAMPKGGANETTSAAGEHRWPSLYQGLYPLDPNENSSSNSNAPNNSNSLHVLGVSGSYETLGPITARKLEYASSQATHVLRRCFAETTVGKHGLAKAEFEIEILETGALIRFLQIARSTYIPDWVDVDV